jgi:hypothetical protein
VSRNCHLKERAIVATKIPTATSKTAPITATACGGGDDLICQQISQLLGILF